MQYHLLLIAGLIFVGQAQTTVAENANEARDKPRKILLDTDPGADDIFALLWLQSLAKQGKAEIVAVTTVDGNVQSKYTFANASKALALGGFEQVEVGRGVPVHDPAEGAAYIHGADGMGNLSKTLPPPGHRLSEARYAHDIIIDKLSATPGEIALVAVGPLTNLAAAEEKSPGILGKAKEIVIMGGVFHGKGNITSHAEFNIHYDPESAQKVFSSRDDIVVLPLDVTQKITLTPDRINAIKQESKETRITEFLYALSLFTSKTTMSYRETDGIRGFHVHDASTLAYLFYPETLLLRRARVRVETQAEWTRGQTVLDDRHVAKTETNSWVALEVDSVNVLAVLIEDLKVLAESQ